MPGIGAANWACVQLVSSAAQKSKSGIVRIIFQPIPASPGQQEYRLQIHTNLSSPAVVCMKRSFKQALLSFFICGALFTAKLIGQTEIPDWCRALPRPEYKTLQRVPMADGWFEVYKVAPAVFAIYEPHQAEETIGYLIVGQQRALLFDTGMGIGDVKNVTAQLTHLPIVVLNSHTHNDHVGGNWQFDAVYGIDTDFTRERAQGSRAAAQEEIAPGQICGTLPKGFDRTSYATRPWKITKFIHDGDHIDLGGRSLTILATPGHTPDAICLFDAANGLLFTGDTYYPGTIWIYSPATNLAAYDASVRRLAALAPQVRMVLGSHNIPVASPSVLPQLVTAFEAARDHKVPATPAGAGKVTYKVDNFSFLMRDPVSKP
jgi:glyoxylase-like metal-dependent hydrolase (beta-lactamase superfamily II)